MKDVAFRIVFGLMVFVSLSTVAVVTATMLAI